MAAKPASQQQAPDHELGCRIQATLTFSIIGKCGTNLMLLLSVTADRTPLKIIGGQLRHWEVPSKRRLHPAVSELQQPHHGRAALLMGTGSRGCTPKLQPQVSGQPLRNARHHSNWKSRGEIQLDGLNYL